MNDYDRQAGLRAAGYHESDHRVVIYIPWAEKLWREATRAGKLFDESFQLYD